MTTIHLKRALDGLAHHDDVCIEKRCDECVPTEAEAKVRAVSVVSTARCDSCARLFRQGESFWAVFGLTG